MEVIAEGKANRHIAVTSTLFLLYMLSKLANICSANGSISKNFLCSTIYTIFILIKEISEVETLVIALLV